MDILISNLLLESIFDFGKWSNWKDANTCICVLSVWPLPKVQNWFWKQIWNENVHISMLFFLFSVLVSIFKKVKKWISNCISTKVTNGHLSDTPNFVKFPDLVPPLWKVCLFKTASMAMLNKQMLCFFLATYEALSLVNHKA